MKKCFLFGVVLLFLACNNSAEDQQATEDSISGTIIINELDSISTISNSFVQLDSSFDQTSFSKVSERTIQEAEDMPLNAEQMLPFMPYLIYNSDSSKAIDPYSYNFIINERKGTRRVDDAGPDFEIGLIDVKSKTRRRIWFSGPAARIIEAKWKSNHELWLAGVEEVSAESYIPFILEIDTRTNKAASYESGDTIQMTGQSGLRQALEAKMKIKTSPAF